MDLFLLVVIVLFVLAISDLVVGVSNDAANFLNSAIGSKVAPRYIIMIVASIGIVIGTTFSSGLMEVARKGIFNPDQFLLPEIMVIFLAVMITDVMLLDLYNTFALPTSTTVSIVFELLGSAVAVSLIKMSNSGENLSELINYINTSKALAIISGILISVVVAFTVGAIFQFITRMIFTFDYEKRIKRYGAIWGAVALTAITFFILIKGAKGASFITKETSEWIIDNTNLIILVSIGFWTIILQLLMTLFKVNILKPIVLLGTFALALAFAANDLVNFIGVPLAGLATYNIGLDSIDPANLLMEALNNPVKTSTTLLLIAGIIMAVTLWFSKKANSVTKTEVNLGRQFEGFERFESSLLSRTLVRMSVSVKEIYEKIIPAVIRDFLKARFDNSGVKNPKGKDKPSFDLIRASVNLVVSSILISFATSLKLPLSTTYVTFMVAMGTSLSDKAWGRDSAVYRVNGVLTVIGGWFFTAFLAFTVSGIFATLIYFFELPAILVLLGLAAYFVFRTHVLHKKREKEEVEYETEKITKSDSGLDTISACMEDVHKFVDLVSTNVGDTFNGLYEGDREILKSTKKQSKKIAKSGNKIVDNIFTSVKMLGDEDLKKSHRYGRIIGSIQDISTNLRNLNQRCFDHIDNNHNKPSKVQIEDLKNLYSFFVLETSEIKKILDEKDFSQLDAYNQSVENLQNALQKFDINQIIRVKSGLASTRSSILFLDILSDIENISDHLTGIIKVCRKNMDNFSKKLSES
ncbi:MAG: inorganic phosphate transporter [Melioribacteraceae bacterium]|nr:inorganic phosphate transporter [Melioribacteraceae bacterium]MCF8355707.1 inorganic phosphate transporter [Melioribacteraceae bacterium]MCF8394437.1 inorganic phosphate transporter [Melioribacteraceae bacterium]MCF8418571.1 inorganic phosphate transporter [Melioribacteraceae bacterium]